MVSAGSSDRNTASDQGDGDTGSDALRSVRGIIACIAWVILFPVGAIAINVIKSHNALWIHASVQGTSVFLVLASAVTGIVLANNEGEMDSTHAIIGLTLFGAVFVQVVGGIVHHWLYQRHARRTIISHLHIWLGRSLITLGMVNGGLGLQLAGDEGAKITAYGVVAGIIWAAYVVVAVLSSRKRSKSAKY